MDPKVDAFLERAPRWRCEIEQLRTIALECGLQEVVRWGKPCYAYHGSNVGIIQPFKNHCAFMFFKGALLSDPDGLLERPGKNSHAARRLMIANMGELVAMNKALRAFIQEAIEVEKSGKQVPPKKKADEIPDELSEAFEEVPGAEAAFSALTPGRQRAYILHFAGAKHAKTRRSRIEKLLPRILDGKGLRD